MQEEVDNEYVYFDVPGAGKIQISRSTSIKTGGIEGFSFGVEWSKYPYIGGVLSKEEAVKLASFILRSVNLDRLIED